MFKQSIKIIFLINLLKSNAFNSCLIKAIHKNFWQELFISLLYRGTRLCWCLPLRYPSRLIFRGTMKGNDANRHRLSSRVTDAGVTTWNIKFLWDRIINRRLKLKSITCILCEKENCASNLLFIYIEIMYNMWPDSDERQV